MLNFTCAVRDTGPPAFSGGTTNTQTTTVDGLTYTIEANTTLTGTWDRAVTWVSSSYTPPSGSGLPADLTGTGWKYHTFTAAPDAGKVFLRAKVEK